MRIKVKIPVILQADTGTADLGALIQAELVRVVDAPDHRAALAETLAALQSVMPGEWIGHIQRPGVGWSQPTREEIAPA